MKNLARHRLCPYGSNHSITHDPPKNQHPSATIAQQLRHLDERLRTKLHRFAKHLGVDPHASCALAGAAHDETLRELVDDYGLFQDRFLGEACMAKSFLMARRADLQPHEIAWLESQCASHMSIYEVIDCDGVAPLQLRNRLHPGDNLWVHPKQQRDARLRRGVHLLARVVEHDGLALICGMHHALVDTELADAVARRVCIEQAVHPSQWPTAVPSPDVQSSLLFWWDVFADMGTHEIRPWFECFDCQAEPGIAESFSFDPAQRQLLIDRLLMLAGMTTYDDGQDEAMYLSLVWAPRNSEHEPVFLTVYQDELDIETACAKAHALTIGAVTQALASM